jgi:YD repeat-containing protein
VRSDGATLGLLARHGERERLRDLLPAATAAGGDADVPGRAVQEFEVRLSVLGSALSSLPASCRSFAPIDSARVSFAPVGPTLGKLELVGSDQVEVIGSWPVAMQLFNSGYSLFNPDLYKYTGPDGQVFVVDKTAGLKSLTDRAGNVLTMTPAGITSSHPQVPGSTLGIVPRDRGPHHTSPDPQGRSLVYAYDANGDLQSATDRENSTTTFGYLEDPAHHLETIDDPLGRTPIKNEYDPSGRLLAHVDAFGNRIVYQHDLLGRQEIVKDRTGAQRVLEYDERGNVVRETDPQGRIVVRSFDPRNNRLSETEPTIPRTPTRSDHDLRLRLPGQPAQHHGRSRATRAPTPTTRPRQVLTTTDARNHTTTSAYDPKGNLLDDRCPEQHHELRTTPAATC